MISQLPITRIVIAHRPLLVERAHLVFELKDGALSPAARSRRVGIDARR